MIRILEGSVFIDDVEEFLDKIENIRRESKTVIQALNADHLAGEEHIRFAVEKAIQSFKTGKGIANDLAKEILLYAAGTRQISRAMRMGIHGGQNNIALVAFGENPDLSGFNEITQRPVLQYDECKKEILMDIFNITTKEIEAAGADKIPDLVLERVALMEVIK